MRSGMQLRLLKMLSVVVGLGVQFPHLGSLRAEVLDAATAEFPLYYLGKGSSKQPQLKMRVDYLRYSGKPSFRRFLQLKDRSSPERVFADYVQGLVSGSIDFSTFATFYSPEEDKEALKRSYQEQRKWSTVMRDVKFRDRYDIGGLSYLSCWFDYREPESLSFALPGWTFVLRRTDKGAYLSTIWPFAPSPVGALISLHQLNEDAGLSPSVSGEFKYSLRIPSEAVGDPPDQRPLTVSFNGQLYDLPIGEDTVCKDALCRFVKSVINVYRSGSRQDWFSLWTPEDASEWESDLEEDPYVYGSEKSHFDRTQPRLVLAIDFGPNVAVFLKDDAAKQGAVELFMLVRSSKGTYELTRGIERKGGEWTFDPNVQALFESKIFQDFVRSLVGN